MKSKCIDTQTLMDYFHDVLSDGEKEQLLGHLVDCADCRDIFNSACRVMRNPELDRWLPISEGEAKSILKEIEFKSSVFGKIAGLFKKLGGLLTVPNRMPALSPVRSSRNGNDILLDRFFHESKTRMTVKRGYNGKATVWVGCANGITEIDTVLLIREEGGIISLPFDEKEVSFDGLSFGKYSLTMMKGDTEKDKCFFQIDETGVHEREHDHT